MLNCIKIKNEKDIVEEKVIKMCQHKDSVAYCISCQDTICIDCLRDEKSCKNCHCLYNMNCSICDKMCHSDAYICYYCDFSCCKLCLRKNLETSINDFLCPNTKCNELLTLFDTIKILGLPWFNNDYKKHKKRILYDFTMLKKSDKKIECKLCNDSCTVSNNIVECKKCDKIYNVKTMEVYDPIYLADIEHCRPNIKKIAKENLEKYEKCLEFEPKLDKYRDRIEIDLFKIHKAKLVCREVNSILFDINNIGFNDYNTISKLNQKLETIEKYLKIKCFRIVMESSMFPEIYYKK